MGRISVSIMLIFVLIPSYAILAEASGKIVFVGEGSHICTMNPDGTNIRHLTEEPGNYMYPKWSPDSTKIAYLHGKLINQAYALQLWMINADGSLPELLYDRDVGLGGPSWSPNGDEIAFPVNGETFIMDLDTRKTRPLVMGYAPVWSPDGKAIAYEPRLNTDELLLIDPGTGRKWSIDHTREGVDVRHKHWSPVSWSPDSKRIAFMGIERGGQFLSIYVMNSDGSGLKKEYSGATYPIWSPDGKQIMFGTNRGIEVMDIDGRKSDVVYTNGSYPDWTRPSAAVNFHRKVAATWGSAKNDVLSE